MKCVEFIDVTKKIKKNTVLESISLSIEYGRVTGLRGVNGSGKTMLMRLIAGLIHPTAGQVFVDGKELGREIEFPESIGLLIENPAFLDSYDGFNNLRLLASLGENVPEDEINGLLSKVGLSHAGDKKFKKYSLGMKQRLGIAGAILGSPNIILLDEPTNALDTGGVEILSKIIKSQAQRGAAVIVACHDVNFLDAVSDEIFCLENGRLTDHTLCERGVSQ